MDDKIKFTCIQVSDFIDVMGQHGIGLDVESDARMSAMFSDLLITMARSLDGEQAETYHNAI